MQKLNEIFHSNVAKASIGAGALVASAVPAFAQALDVSSVTGALGSAGTAVGTVALAMLAVAGAGIAIKWFLGFLFS